MKKKIFALISMLLLLALTFPISIFGNTPEDESNIIPIVSEMSISVMEDGHHVLVVVGTHKISITGIDGSQKILINGAIFDGRRLPSFSNTLNIAKELTLMNDGNQIVIQYGMQEIAITNINSAQKLFVDGTALDQLPSLSASSTDRWWFTGKLYCFGYYPPYSSHFAVYRNDKWYQGYVPLLHVSPHPTDADSWIGTYQGWLYP